MGVGLGPYMKWKTDARQDSRFVFGVRAFVGYRFWDNVGIELVTTHFSNGNLTPVNAAYNFAGLQVSINF